MDEETIAKAAYGAKCFLTAYQKLANVALERHQFLFKVRPKSHFFVHLVKTMTRDHWNPRRMSCFLDEDYVGRIAKLTRSTSRVTCSLRVLQRYLLFLATRWEARVQRGSLLV